MAEYSQIERILRIIQIISSGTKITTSALLHRFDNQVSLRTLQRDLNRIGQAGIPIKSRKTMANENEWFLDSHFRSFIPQTLGLNEYLAAHMLKENLKIFRNTEFSDEIDSLFEKIEQLVPDDVFQETDDAGIEDLFGNYTAGLFDYSGYGEIINTIIEGITQKQKCFVSYYNAYEDVRKNFYIEPHRIIYFKGGLYVIGYLRRLKTFRLLAIQRIQKFKMMGETYPDKPQFDPELFWKGKFGLFSGKPEKVKLKFSAEVRIHIEGRHWHSSQSYHDEEDGSLILELTVGLSPELISWIFNWNEYVEVLAPDKLRTIMRKKLKKLNKIYPAT